MRKHAATILTKNAIAFVMLMSLDYVGCVTNNRTAFNEPGPNRIFKPEYEVPNICTKSEMDGVNATDWNEDNACLFCPPCPLCVFTSNCCGVANKTAVLVASYAIKPPKFVVSNHSRAVCHRSSPFKSNLVTYYNMVTSCLNGSECPGVTGKFKLSDMLFLKDAFPVHGRLDHTLYLNRKCAQCNLVTDIVHWQPDIGYGKAALTTNWKQFIDHFNSGLSVFPPRNLKHMFPRCNVKIYKQCNATGYWTNYDEQLRMLCEDSDIDIPLVLGHVGYKNIYCYLCDRPKRLHKYAMCYGPKAGSIYVDINYDPSAFMADLPPPRCPHHKVFVEKLNRCFTLFCEYGKAAILGQCFELPVRLKSAERELYFFLKLVPDTIVVSTDGIYHLNNDTEVAENVVAVVGLRFCKLRRVAIFIFKDRFYEGNPLPYFHILMTVILTETTTCPFEEVAAKFERLYRKENDLAVELRINNQSKPFSVFGYQPPMHEDNDLYYNSLKFFIDMDKFSHNKYTPNHMNDTDKITVHVRIILPQNCPFIIIDDKQYCTITSDQISNCSVNETLRDVFIPFKRLIQHTYYQQYYRVCLGDLDRFTNPVTIEARVPSDEIIIKTSSMDEGYRQVMLVIIIGVVISLVLVVITKRLDLRKPVLVVDHNHISP